MNATKTTGQIIKELRESQGMTQSDLAKEMNVSRQIISYYETNARMPNIDDIKHFAKRFNISADYLLGLSDNETTDPEVKAICNYTGLSDEAVEALHFLSEGISSGNATTAFYTTDGKYIRTAPSKFVFEFINQIVLHSDFSESSFLESVYHIYRYIRQLKSTEKKAEEACRSVPKMDIGLITLLKMGDSHSHGHKEIKDCLDVEDQFRIAMSEYYQAVKAFEKCIDIFCIDERISCDESMERLNIRMEERMSELRERENNVNDN